MICNFTTRPKMVDALGVEPRLPRSKRGMQSRYIKHPEIETQKQHQCCCRRATYNSANFQVNGRGIGHCTQVSDLKGQSPILLRRCPRKKQKALHSDLRSDSPYFSD